LHGVKGAGDGRQEKSPVSGITTIFSISYALEWVGWNIQGLAFADI
jgi:hypothetical protein